MADPPGPGAALLDRPAAAASGHDLDALVGCLAPGDRHQAAAHPALGFPGADQVLGDRAQIFTVVPGLPAAARCPACGTGVAWPEGPRAGTRTGRTAPRVAGVIIVGGRDSALPDLAWCLDAAAQVLGLRDAPGDRQEAAACRDRARTTAGRLGMTGRRAVWTRR